VVASWVKHAKLVFMKSVKVEESKAWAIFRAPRAVMNTLLELSEKDGYFIRPFFEKGSTERPFELVPVPSEMTLKGVLAKLAAGVPDHFGLAVSRRGLVLRVS
jgi:hypothetical protein